MLQVTIHQRQSQRQAGATVKNYPGHLCKRPQCCATLRKRVPFLPLKNTTTTECYDPFTRRHEKVAISRPLTKYICTIILKDTLMLCYITIVSNISYQIMIPSLGQNDPTTETHTEPSMSHNILREEVLIQSRTDTHN